MGTGPSACPFPTHRFFKVEVLERADALAKENLRGAVSFAVKHGAVKLGEQRVACTRQGHSLWSARRSARWSAPQGHRLWSVAAHILRRACAGRSGPWDNCYSCRVAVRAGEVQLVELEVIFEHTHVDRSQSVAAQEQHLRVAKQGSGKARETIGLRASGGAVGIPAATSRGRLCRCARHNGRGTGRPCARTGGVKKATHPRATHVYTHTRACAHELRRTTEIEQILRCGRTGWLARGALTCCAISHGTKGRAQLTSRSSIFPKVSGSRLPIWFDETSRYLRLANAMPVGMTVSSLDCSRSTTASPLRQASGLDAVHIPRHHVVMVGLEA